MNKNDNNARLLQQNHQPEINGENSAYRLLGVLFDEGSFVELGAYVSGSASSEGVVTGYGTVDGRLVYAYAQDNGVIGGAIGSNTAKKVSNIIDMAVKTGSPLISILNSNGVRINEGIDVLSCIGTNLQKRGDIRYYPPNRTCYRNLRGQRCFYGPACRFCIYDRKKFFCFFNRAGRYFGSNRS